MDWQITVELTAEREDAEELADKVADLAHVYDNASVSLEPVSRESGDEFEKLKAASRAAFESQVERGPNPPEQMILPGQEEANYYRAKIRGAYDTLADLLQDLQPVAKGIPVEEYLAKRKVEKGE